MTAASMVEVSATTSSGPTSSATEPAAAAARAAIATDSIELPPGGALVFFDGVCGFCNHTVDFLIRHDRHDRLRFAPLQGVTAVQILPSSDRDGIDSLVVWTPGRVWRWSSATVQILWRMGGLWSLLSLLLWLVPRPLRDLGYRLVARNRYRFFGRKESCRLPTPAERARFLP